MDGFLMLAFLFLIAGVIAVPIAARLGLGSVLGYLLAGITISPLLQALKVDVVSIQHFAEFGVVMMLFLVGLELEPHKLWSMRARLFGLGSLQVVLTTAAITAAFMATGQPWQVALAVGLVLSLSSTAIVLQTLNERGLLKSDGGQSSFSVLLLQDISFIPMLAFLPLLALPELTGMAVTASPTDVEPIGASSSLVDYLSNWQSALVTLGAITFVIVGGHYFTRPVFRFIAMAHLRELFTAFALLLVIGTAILMNLVGLSPALGAFLVGVVLANSEYRHELKSAIDPFKGLLLGLFFITVGAAIRFDILFEHFAIVFAMTIGLIILKAAILYMLGWMFGITGSHRWLFTIALAQAGEFGFVLLSFTVATSVIPVAMADQLLLVVALSMLLTPLLFITYDKLIAPRFSISQSDEAAEADEIEETGSVIIAGHGRMGGIVNRMLLAAGFTTVVLDFRSDQLEVARAFGIKAYFGDAMRPDLLAAAGIKEAKLLVVTIDNRENITDLVRYVSKTYPHVKIVARAKDQLHVYELWNAGSRDIIRETFDSSLRVGRTALEKLGVHPYDAERQVRGFMANDQKRMRAVADVYEPNIPVHRNPKYVKKSREYMDRAGEAMQGQSAAFNTRPERIWEPPAKEVLADVKHGGERKINDGELKGSDGD